MSVLADVCEADEVDDNILRGWRLLEDMVQLSFAPVGGRVPLVYRLPSTLAVGGRLSLASMLSLGRTTGREEGCALDMGSTLLCGGVD